MLQKKQRWLGDTGRVGYGDRPRRREVWVKLLRVMLITVDHLRTGRNPGNATRDVRWEILTPRGLAGTMGNSLWPRQMPKTRRSSQAKCLLGYHTSSWFELHNSSIPQPSQGMRSEDCLHRNGAPSPEHYPFEWYSIQPDSEHISQRIAEC